MLVPKKAGYQKTVLGTVRPDPQSMCHCRIFVSCPCFRISIWVRTMARPCAITQERSIINIKFRTSISTTCLYRIFSESLLSWGGSFHACSPLQIHSANTKVYNIHKIANVYQIPHTPVFDVSGNVCARSRLTVGAHHPRDDRRTSANYLN